VGARTRRVTALVERLLFDLAGTGYGRGPELDYVDRATADAIAEAYRPYSAGRYRVESDFGDSCAGVAYFDGDREDAVRVEVELEDRSIVCTPDGTRTMPERRRWQITLLVDTRAERILEMRMEGPRALTGEGPMRA